MAKPGPRKNPHAPRKREARRQTKVVEKILEKVERRGGTRVGAGRPPGTRAIAKRLMNIRSITEDIIREGKVPLRVMIKNMIYYDEQAVYLDEQLHDALVDNAKRFDPDKFIHALELVNKIGDARMKATQIASMAAPYLHPRLSAVDMLITKREAPRDIKPDADVEKYREDFRQLRSAPFIIEQTEVEVDETEESE